MLSLFRRPVKITATFEVAIVCALGDAQCKTRKFVKKNDHNIIP